MPEWRSFLPRIVAIEALYAAFGRTGDQQTALAVYRLIEECYPLRGMNRGDMVHAADSSRVILCDDKATAEELNYLSAGTSERARVSRAAILLGQMAIRLAAVTTAEEFRHVLAEFTPKLKGP